MVHSVGPRRWNKGPKLSYSILLSEWLHRQRAMGRIAVAAQKRHKTLKGKREFLGRTSGEHDQAAATEHTLAGPRKTIREVVPPEADIMQWPMNSCELRPGVAFSA